MHVGVGEHPPHGGHGQALPVREAVLLHERFGGGEGLIRLGEAGLDPFLDLLDDLRAFFAGFNLTPVAPLSIHEVVGHQHEVETSVLDRGAQHLFHVFLVVAPEGPVVAYPGETEPAVRLESSYCRMEGLVVEGADIHGLVDEQRGMEDYADEKSVEIEWRVKISLVVMKTFLRSMCCSASPILRSLSPLP